MGKAEVSTRSLRVSRRGVLAAAASVLSGTTSHRSTAAARLDGRITDTAVLAWKAWRVAYRRKLSLCRKQQLLEAKLVRTIGYPHLILIAAELASPVRIGSPEQFDQIAVNLPSLRTRRDEVVAGLSMHQRRWDDADRAIGYSASLLEEARACVDEQRLIAELFAVEARSLLGVFAKLDVLLAVEAGAPELQHSPWSELQLIRQDVARLLSPGQSR